MFKGCKKEIWLVGDINVEDLNRYDENRTTFLDLFGLKQYIEDITTFNIRGGTCVDCSETSNEFYAAVN